MGSIQRVEYSRAARKVTREKRPRADTGGAVVFTADEKVPTEHEVEELRVDLMGRAEKFANECSKDKNKKNVLTSCEALPKRRIR